MRIALTVPADSVDERTLGAALEAATEVAQTQIERGRTQPLSDAISGGLRWSPEPNPPGEESFDIPQTQDERGWADCDDLAPRWAAELRASGVDPDATPIVYRSGPDRWHVVVERGDGTIEDPSRWAGMGQVAGGRIPVLKPMGDSGKLVVGFEPSGRGVRARLDVPVLGHDGSGVSVQRFGADAFDALERATRAAGVLAMWGAPDDVLARLAALGSAIRGEEGDFSAYGPFIADVAGAFDLGQAADLAATLVDPLGLRHLAAPLAQEFVQSYATSLANKGAGAGAKTNTKTPPASTVGATPRTTSARGGAGGRGAARGGGGGGRTSSARGGGGGGRQGGRTTQPAAPQFDPTMHSFVDPDTGLPIDPVTGFLYDQSTGLYYDPDSGNMMDATTHMIFDATGNGLGMYQGPPPVLSQLQPPGGAFGAGAGYVTPAAGYGLAPGYAPQQYSFGGGPVAPGPSSTSYPTGYYGY